MWLAFIGENVVMAGNLQSKRLGNNDWLIRTYMTWSTAEQCFAGRAEIFLAGILRCRVTLPQGFLEADAATASLHRRAEDFIADWSHRAHSAETEFSEF
jgi:hypothetical protein